MEKLTLVTGPLSPKRILSKEDLFEALSINADDYIIGKIVANKRDTHSKDKDAMIINENIQVKVELTPRIKKELISIKELLNEYVSRDVALHHSVNPMFGAGSDRVGTLGSMMIYDAHVDKLDVKNTSISQKIKKILEGANRLLDKLSRFDIEKMLFVNGGDYFNSASGYKTKAGTPQENNCTERDAWKYGMELQIELLELISKLAPVEAIFIEGNHEAEKLTYLRDVMSVYFKNNMNVDIQEGNFDRQYYQYGKTLMGFTHGDKIKPANLVTVAHQENSKQDYDNLEMFQGHLHKSSKETYAGAIVEVLTGASGQNEWARGHGYDLRPGQINGYVHDKEKGRIAHLIQHI